MSTVAVPSRERHGRGSALLLTLVAAAFHVLVQTSPLWTRRDFSLEHFRNYYPFDQLSYLAIVADGSQGRLGLFEPFTETGHSFYPSGYYRVLGLLARLTGMSPTAVWGVAGVVLQGVVVALLAWTLVRATGRRWPALLAPLVGFVGVFAGLEGSWLRHVGTSHGVQWGTFAQLYVINGNVAGEMVAAAGLLLLLLVALGKLRRPMAWAVVACVLLGSVANVQTYSFLAGVYLAAYAAAAVGTSLVRRWRLVLGAGLVLIVVIVLGGPSVLPRLNPLAGLVAGLVPTAPGLVALVVRTRLKALWAGCAAVLAALPQIGWTVWGNVVADPFLTYRQVSSSGLGMSWRTLVAGGAVPLLALGVVALAGILARRARLVALAVAPAIAWLLMGLNDRWGVNQEPYRMWLDGFTLTCFVALPLLLHVLLESWRGAGRQGRVAVGVAALIVTATTAVAAVDYPLFWTAQRSQPPLVIAPPPMQAVSRALAEVGQRGNGEGGILLSDPCLDPFLVKQAALRPVLFFNEGLAWPVDVEPARRTVTARAAGTLDVGSARAAGVTMIVTLDGCAGGWDQSTHLEPWSDAVVDDAHVRLWRLTGA